MYSMVSYPEDSLPRNVAHIMTGAANDDRGTVAALASLSRELDEQHEDSECFLCLFEKHLDLLYLQ